MIKKKTIPLNLEIISMLFAGAWGQLTMYALYNRVTTVIDVPLFLATMLPAFLFALIAIFFFFWALIKRVKNQDVNWINLLNLIFIILPLYFVLPIKFLSSLLIK